MVGAVVPPMNLKCFILSDFLFFFDVLRDQMADSSCVSQQFGLPSLQFCHGRAQAGLDSGGIGGVKDVSQVRKPRLKDAREKL